MSSEKKSQFIETESVSDSQYIPIFGSGVDRKISKPNFFTQLKSEYRENFTYEFDTLSSLIANMDSLEVGMTVGTKGCLSAGDGGHGTFDIVSIASLTVDGYSVIGSGPYAVLRVRDGKISSKCLGVFGGIADETQGMIRCVNFSNATGCEIILPAGTVNTDQILIDNKFFRVSGLGRDLSIIKLRAAVVAQNGVSILNGGRFYASKLTIDANALEQIGGHGIRSGGCNALALSDVSVINSKAYGIGVQDGANHGIVLDDVLVDGTGEDGLDFKDKAYSNSVIKLNNITVKNYGSSSTSSGIDFRGEVQATNIKIFMSADRKGFRFRLDDGVQGRNGFGTVTNIDVRASGSNLSVGYAIQIEGGDRNYAINNLTVNGIGGAVLIESYARGGVFNNISATNITEFASIFGRDITMNNIYAQSTTGSARLIDFEPGCDNIQINNFGLDDTTAVTNVVRVDAAATNINLSNGWIRGGGIGGAGTATQSNVRLI